MVFTAILLFDEIMRCNRPLCHFPVNVASRTIKCRISQMFVYIYMHASVRIYVCTYVCICMHVFMYVCIKGALRL